MIVSMPSDLPAPLSSAEQLSGIWARQERWWHAAFVLIWGSAVAVTLLARPGPHGRWPELVILGVIGVAYAVCGLRAMSRQDSERWGWAYLVLAWGGLIGTQLVNPDSQAWLLYFILFAHLWVMLERRVAALATVVLALTMGAIRLLQSDLSRDAITAVGITSVLSLAPALVLGLFIDRMVNEARTRAETIDELRATQADLAAAERDRGVLEERERLSREIHDTLAQGFTSVLTLSRAADAALARGDIDTARERLALVDATARDNLSEARLIVAELTPGHLQSRTLVEALGRLVAAVSSESQVTCSLGVEGDPVPLGGTGEVVLLRCAQECLANVRRHAGARRCSVTADYRDPQVVVLTVSDDGRGFDPTARPSGYGLDGLRARATEVGGSLSVTSTLGRGTTVTLEVSR